MLEAYMDDSGSHDDAATCLVAGYWGAPKTWKKFEKAWKDVLAQDGASEFHATDFWQRPPRGEFKDWDEYKRKQFMFRLLTIIRDHRVYPFGFGVLKSAWEHQPIEFRKIYAGFRRSEAVKEQSVKPLYLPFQLSIARTAGYCREGLKMNFVFDMDRKITSQATVCYSDLLRDSYVAENGLLNKIGDLTFASSHETVPLQAADLLAYELYRFGKQRIAKGENQRPREELYWAMARMKNINDFWLFDDTRFKNLRDHLIQYVETRRREKQGIQQV